MNNLSSEVKKILSNHIQINENSLMVTKKLSEKEYKALNDTLGRIGGKWERGKKAHVFPCDPRPLLAHMIETNLLPENNPTAFFPTPLDGIEEMWSFCDEEFFKYCASSESLYGKVQVLEPSGGVGAIADFVKTKGDNVEITIVELLEENQNILKSKGYSPICGSFLDYSIPTEEENKFDFVFMNPPFSVKGDKRAYMTHIDHALKMLRSNGELIAIVPVGWITGKTKKDEAFRNLISEHGHNISTLPEGTFKESGTNIATKVIKLTPRAVKQMSHGGFNNGHENEFMIYATQERSNYNYLCALSEKMAYNTISDNDLYLELKNFSLELIDTHAKGDKVKGIYGDVFITTKYLESYISHLTVTCKEYSLFYKDTLPEEIIISDSQNNEKLSIARQLDIVSSGGGLMDLLYAL